MASGFLQLGDYAKSLKVSGQAKEIFLKHHNQLRASSVLSDIADAYMRLFDLLGIK